MLRSSFAALSSAGRKGKARQVLEPVVVLSRSLATNAAESLSAPGPSSANAQASSSAVIESNQTALSLLKSQSNHYVVASITGRTYLVSKGDLITTPRLKDARIGDVLILDKVHEVGSRDYTLRAQNTLNTRRISSAVDLAAPHPIITASLRPLTSPQPTDSAEVLAKAQERALAFSNPITPQTRRLFTRLSLGTDERSPLIPLADSWTSRLVPNGLAHIGSVLPPSTVRVTAIVTEQTKGALEKIVKFKRRKGYKRTIEHKQAYTRIRIEDIQIQPK